MIRVENLQRETTIKGQRIMFWTHDIQELDQVIAKYREKPLQVKFEPVRKKRSLNANAYHYALCEEIAKAIRTTGEEVHRSLMRDYGAPLTNEAGKIRFTLLEYDPNVTGLYLRPTGHMEDRKGISYQWFIIIKPSHLYDTAEMSRLIDGTIDEAKLLGIETTTPDEIERMKSQWGEAQ